VLSIPITVVRFVPAHRQNGLWGIYRLDNYADDLQGTSEGELFFNELYRLTQLGFQREKSEKLEESTRRHLTGSKIMYIVSAGRELNAYAVLDLIESSGGKILYLSGIMVDPAAQGKNLASNLLTIALKEHCSRYLATRTQNPVMYQCIAKVCDQSYPNPFLDPTPEVMEVGSFVALGRLGMKIYDPERMIGEGVYGSCLYGKPPISRTTKLEQWFKSRVNLERGDAMIVVGLPRSI
jgi:GNAT superfamily N-acetyltransferase